MKTLAALFLFLPTLASAQTFFEGALFATHVSESGPTDPRSETFSTNWFAAGVTRGSMTFRLRGSMERLTVGEDGYPQLLQSGNVMRARDTIGEAALDVRWRALHVYAAPIGEPPLGAEPFERRASSTEFAEAPFTYGVAESWRRVTRVVAAGVRTSALEADAGVFRDGWSARAIVHPRPSIALQLSRGTIDDDAITSASISHTAGVLALSALWTRREARNGYGTEATAHLGRNVLMGRVENIDDGTHVTLGYLFDVFARPQWRAGIGANVDYHPDAEGYGHKPQSVYLFVRLRGGSAGVPPAGVGRLARRPS